MRTLIRVENANCTDCLNAIQDVLMARSLVRSVQLHAADGCIEVEHDHDEPDALVELLRTSLRGWQIADNGEIIQVPSVPEAAHVCHLDDRRSQPGAARDTTTAGPRWRVTMLRPSARRFRRQPVRASNG